MELLTNDLRKRLLQNGRLRKSFSEEGVAEPDFFPVAKLFTPDANCTWLLTELDPDESASAHVPGITLSISSARRS